MKMPRDAGTGKTERAGVRGVRGGTIVSLLLVKNR